MQDNNAGGMRYGERMEHEFIAAYQSTLKTLDELAQPLWEEYRPYTQCRKGCAGCCRDGFKIRYLEARYLLLGLVEAPPEVVSAIFNRLQDPSPEAKSQCPLLVDGACSLYEFRPALCRAYGLLIKLNKDTSTCTLNFKDVPQEVKLKTFDIGLFYDLLNDLSQNLWALKAPAGSPAPFLTIRQYLEQFFVGNDSPDPAVSRIQESVEPV